MSKTFSTAKLGRELEVDGVNLNHGTEDQGHRILTIAGGGSGNVEGGELRLLTAADHDTTYNHYRVDVNQDNFRIGRQGQTDITLDASGNTTFAGNATLTTGNLTVGGTGNFTGVVTGPSTDTLLIKDSAGSTLKTIRGV